MKKIALALPLLALAACGTAPATTPPTAVAATAPAPLTDDEVYLGMLRIGGIDGDPEAALDLAANICTAFLEGNTQGEISSAISQAGFTISDADYIISSAVDSYCPEFG